MSACRVPAQYYGWTPTQLSTALTATQQAIFDLTTGGKLETASYTQGDGAKSVTYTRADLGALQQQVQILAGLVSGDPRYGRRRPLRPLYR
jgi:hypothetical protein